MAIGITLQQQTQVSELFVAMFGRAPTSDGLGYWANELVLGTSLTAVADQMFATDPARAYYPAGSTNDYIISSFFLNVLGRPVQAGGLKYWGDQLNLPNATPGSVINAMITAVTLYQAGDNPDTAIDALGVTSAALFANKSTVALEFALNPLSAGNVTAAIAALTGVTADVASVTTVENANDAALAGASNTSFTLTAGTDTQTANAFNATGLTLNTLDHLTGATGTGNSLNIVDSAGNQNGTIPGATLSNIQTINVNTVGSVGQVSTGGSAATKQVDTFTAAKSSVVASETFTVATATNAADTVTVHYGAATPTVSAAVGASTTTTAAAIAAAINSAAGSAVATSTGAVVTVYGPASGAAIPAITLVPSAGTTTVDAAAPLATGVTGATVGDTVLFNIGGIVGSYLVGADSNTTAANFSAALTAANTTGGFGATVSAATTSISPNDGTANFTITAATALLPTITFTASNADMPLGGVTTAGAAAVAPSTAAVYDLSGITGLTAFNVTNSTGADNIKVAATTAVSVVDTAGDVTIVGGGGALHITDGAGAIAVGQTSVINAFTSATIKGGTTVAIRDMSSTGPAVGSTLTSVSLDGNTGAATLIGKGLVNVTVANGVAASNVTITNATASHTQNLTLNNDTTLTITDAIATTVNVASAGTKANDVALAVTKATAIHASGAADLTLDTTGANYAALTSVSVADSGAFTADLTGATLLTAVNASTSTGTNSVTLNANQAYQGGSGVDTVILTAVPTVAMSGGGGSADVLEFNGLGALSALTALSMANATGFEVLELAGAISGTLNMGNLAAGLTSLVFSSTASAGAPITVTGGFSNTALTFLGSLGNTVTYTQATDTANDSLTVNLATSKTAALITNTLVADSIEHVAIVSNGLSTALPFINVLSGSLAAATTVTVTGAAGLDLTGTALNAATTVDGSAMTGFLNVITLVTSGATVTAGTGGARIVGATASTGDTFTIGANAGSSSSIVHAGNGNNTIHIGAMGATATEQRVTVGNGDNIITLGDNNGVSSSIVSAGNGNNTITLGANNNTDGSESYVSVGSGNNHVTIGDAGAQAGWQGVDAGGGNNFITMGNNNGIDSSEVSVGDGNNTIQIGNGGATSTGLYVQAGNGTNSITLGANAGTDSSYVSVGTGSNTIHIGDYSGTGSTAIEVQDGGGTGSNTVVVGNNNGTSDAVIWIDVGDGGNSVTVGNTGALAGYTEVTAGDGNNTISLGTNAGLESSYVTVGSGNNHITIGDHTGIASGVSVYAGNGNNTITLGANAGTDSSYVYVGSGSNTVHFGNYTGSSTNGNYIDVGGGHGTNSITLGTGIGFVDLNNGAGANGVNNITLADAAVATIYMPSASWSTDGTVANLQYTTLTSGSFAAGEVIDFSAGENGTVVQTTLGAKVTGASLTAELNAAAANTGAGTTSVLHWFETATDTYIVEDNSNLATFDTSADVVIKIVGLHTISSATVDAAGVVTIV